MKESPRTALRHELTAIENLLRCSDLWSTSVPSPSALASTVPFAADTLAFHDWLQFLFIPRLRSLIASGLPLPAVCGLAPMAEVFLRQRGVQLPELLVRLRTIDQLVTDND